MFKDFIEPITNKLEYKPHQIGSSIELFKGNVEQLNGKKLALLGVPEGRSTNKNEHTAKAAEQIRFELYKLTLSPALHAELIDLGNLFRGDQFSDTAVALLEVTTKLRQMGIVPIILGGSLNLSYAIYQAFGDKNNVDVTFISANLPLLEHEVLHQICSHEPNYLYNISALGFQGHQVPKGAMDTLEKLCFDHMRLGTLRSDFEEAEPLIRNTDLFLFDIGAVKQADAPANYNNNPNGLDSEQACRLAWYAGVSDITSLFGVFEMNPEFDYRNQTAKLVSQMVWYFMDGFINRKNDHPTIHEDFVKYRCNLDSKHPDMVFHKSKRSDRWWMEIPNPKSVNNKEMNVLVPCSYADYQCSAKGEIPERYLKALRKMH